MPFSTPLHFMASFCSFQDFEAIIITELELGERVVTKLRDSRLLLSLVTHGDEFTQRAVRILA